MKVKRLLAALGVIACLVLLGALNASAAHRVISGQELVKMMGDGKPLVVVDLREPELYAASHVPGAINIPYDGARVRVLKELSPSERIVFICHGGPMGDELAEVLSDHGYNDVYNVAGGMRHWKGPVTK